jgi:hypothetical protein
VGDFYVKIASIESVMNIPDPYSVRLKVSFFKTLYAVWGPEERFCFGP